jgi:hypothetical protein
MRLLTGELYTFEQKNNCRLVPHDKRNHTLWKPHADFLEWAPSPNEICYGRYLEYQPNGNARFTGNTGIMDRTGDYEKSRVFFRLD